MKRGPSLPTLLAPQSVSCPHLLGGLAGSQCDPLGVTCALNVPSHSGILLFVPKKWAPSCSLRTSTLRLLVSLSGVGGKKGEQETVMCRGVARGGVGGVRQVQGCAWVHFHGAPPNAQSPPSSAWTTAWLQALPQPRCLCPSPVWPWPGLAGSIAGRRERQGL